MRMTSRKNASLNRNAVCGRILIFVVSLLVAAPPRAAFAFIGFTSPSPPEEEWHQEQPQPRPPPPKEHPQMPPLPGAPNPGAPAANAKPNDKNAPGGEAPANADVAPPYEPQLLRLSELLGALSYLQDLCGKDQGEVWRGKMSALIDAEAKTPVRKERLAGAYNRGFKGYALTYRLCTPNAELIIKRFLNETAEIAHDVAIHYGPS
jgi:uncharacterized protein (TIGR02301 family)